MTIAGGWGNVDREFVERGDYLIRRELKATFHGEGDTPDVTIELRSDNAGSTVITRAEIVSARGWQPTNSRIAGIDFDTLVMAALVTRAYRKTGDSTWEGMIDYGATESAGDPDGPDPGLVVAMEDLRNRTKRPSRITPQFLQEVAEVYRRALSEGRPPVLAVQDHFDQPTRPRRPTAAGWVWQSRKAGYLPPTDPGRAG